MATPEPPLVFGCLADLRRRRRIDAALSGAADITWFQSFNALHEALGDGHRRACVVVIDVEDQTGASAATFAQVLREFFPGIGVVAYGQAHQRGYADLCGLGAAGVHDVLLHGQSDEGFTARSIILGACRHGAADLVMEALDRVLPLRLLPFAAAVVRNPSKGTIGKITKHLNVHRQTPNFWCKKERYLRPEELLVWCRMFLASALLESTGRTLDSIATELEYASSTSLRNQLKNYTGMTATQIRQAGLDRIVEVFEGRVAQARSGFAGTGDGPSSIDDKQLRADHHAESRGSSG